MEQRELRIAAHFREIMRELGLDVEDSSLADTPTRVAKMYFREFCARSTGHEGFPKMTVFDNRETNNMVVIQDIHLVSLCEHHFLPYYGFAHVGYIPQDNRILGLSKFPRLIKYLGQSPSVQEALTQEIGEVIKERLTTPDVAVVVNAQHLCCKLRGARDLNSTTTTSFLSGVFSEHPDVRQEFFSIIKL